MTPEFITTNWIASKQNKEHENHKKFPRNPNKLQLKSERFYLRRESAVTRRRSSMVDEEEEGRAPRSIRHRTPLRWGKLDAIDWPCNDPGNSGTISTGHMIFQRFLSNPLAQTCIKPRKTHWIIENNGLNLGRKHCSDSGKRQNRGASCFLRLLFFYKDDECERERGREREREIWVK